ncbi:putative transmembrane protein, partial [Apostichopus japonicus]
RQKVDEVLPSKSDHRWCHVDYRHHHDLLATVQGLYDPTFNYKVDSGNFVALITIFFIFGGLYLLYLLFLVIRAFTELRSLPYMNLRLQFMTILMLCVVIASTIITILRFGVSIIKENFVSELSTYYKNYILL